jgi:hypothetical protein
MKCIRLVDESESHGRSERQFIARGGWGEGRNIIDLLKGSRLRLLVLIRVVRTSSLGRGWVNFDFRN